MTIDDLFMLLNENEVPYDFIQTLNGAFVFHFYVEDPDSCNI